MAKLQTSFLDDVNLLESNLRLGGVLSHKMNFYDAKGQTDAAYGYLDDVLLYTIKAVGQNHSLRIFNIDIPEYVFTGITDLPYHSKDSWLKLVIPQLREYYKKANNDAR